jgi:hypothetical protein
VYTTLLLLRLLNRHLLLKLWRNRYEMMRLRSSFNIQTSFTIILVTQFNSTYITSNIFTLAFTISFFVSWRNDYHFKFLFTIICFQIIEKIHKIWLWWISTVLDCILDSLKIFLPIWKVRNRGKFLIYWYFSLCLHYFYI